jgi:hypothetical protein
MDDVVWKSVISAIVTLGLAYIAYLTRKNTQVVASSAAATTEKMSEVKGAVISTAAVAADTASDVKADLVDHTNVTSATLASIGRTLNTVHTLVNSNLGTALASNASLARRLALHTGKSEDATAADIAEKISAEHNAKQSQVDKGG